MFARRKQRMERAGKEASRHLRALVAAARRASKAQGDQALWLIRRRQGAASARCLALLKSV